MKNRGADAILLNVLDPNREVNPQYSSYVVVTNAGRQYTGLITAETSSSLTIQDGHKTNVTLSRSEIDVIRNTGLSLMPEGLEKEIGRQGMVDLIAYLMTVE